MAQGGQRAGGLDGERWLGHRPGGNLVPGKQGGCEMLAQSLALAVDTGGDGTLGSLLPKDDCLSPILPREAACTEGELVAWESAPAELPELPRPGSRGEAGG